MTDRRTDGGDCNIPDAFLKKRWDKNQNNVRKRYIINILF